MTELGDSVNAVIRRGKQNVIEVVTVIRRDGDRFWVRATDGSESDVIRDDEEDRCWWPVVSDVDPDKKGQQCIG